MKHRSGQGIVFECDDCGDSLETDTLDWDEALAYMKDNDWRIRKFSDVWCHYCFGCGESIR